MTLPLTDGSTRSRLPTGDVDAHTAPLAGAPRTRETAAAGHDDQACSPGAERSAVRSGRALRVLVMTTVHTPLDARIHHRQIRALTAAGAIVTYAAPWQDSGTPITAAAPGVVTVDLPRATGRRRLTALTAARRILRRLAPSHDVVLLHDPELVLAVPRRVRRRTPVVLDVHEDLVASLGDRTWIPAALRPWVARMARRVERRAEHQLAGLLLAEEAYGDRFEGRHVVVPNLPWLPSNPPVAGSANRVVYVGRLSIGRGALELLSVARLLAADPSGPQLELVGTADEAVRSVLADAHTSGVLTWHGFLPNDEAMAVVAGSLAGLSSLRGLPNYQHSMPTKVVEYLAHGVPAIVTPLPHAERLVQASGGGEVVPYRDPFAMTAAVRRLAADPGAAAAMGAAGRMFLAEELSWDAVAPRFIAELTRLSRPQPPDPPGPATAQSAGTASGTRCAPQPETISGPQRAAEPETVPAMRSAPQPETVPATRTTTDPGAVPGAEITPGPGTAGPSGPSIRHLTGPGGTHPNSTRNFQRHDEPASRSPAIPAVPGRALPL